MTSNDPGVWSLLGGPPELLDQYWGQEGLPPPPTHNPVQPLLTVPPFLNSTTTQTFWDKSNLIAPSIKSPLCPGAVSFQKAQCIKIPIALSYLTHVRNISTGFMRHCIRQSCSKRCNECPKYDLNLKTANSTALTSDEHRKQRPCKTKYDILLKR